MFPHLKSQYSSLNALCQLFGGILSNIFTGIIADKLAKRTKMSKAYAAILPAIIGVPLIAGVCLMPGISLPLAMALIFLKLLLCEGWMAPSVAMMQETVPPKNQGTVASTYMSFIIGVSNLSSLLIDHLLNKFGGGVNPAILGKIIFTVSALSYVISVPCFYKAG